MMRRTRIALLALVFVLVSCSTTSTQVQTGKALDALGQAFLQTAATWQDARDQGLVTAAEYQDFAKFGETFQTMWAQAYQLWLAGGDRAQLTQLIDQMRRDLTLWALKLAAGKK
jgi:hypothetical protein